MKRSLLLSLALSLSLPFYSAIANEIPKDLQACVSHENMFSHLMDGLTEMVVEKEQEGYYLIRLQYTTHRMWMVASLPCYHHTFVGGDGYPPNFMGLFRGKGKGAKVEKPFTEYAQKSDTEYYLQRYPELQKK
ncbi:hypothetical protein ACSYAD_33910 [Acaryochloris marina NIES-2412]|uniref:hypothetical protein n=1 Tax=Acaryochloris marina TaxID=155978 RepID=UPI004058844D